MGRFTGRTALFFTCAGVVFSHLAPLEVAHAYTATLTPNGLHVRWSGLPKLDVAGNPSNRNGIGDSAFFSAVVKSLQRWKAASGNNVSFDYWQGRDSSVYTPASAYDGLSAIYFASNSGSAPGLSTNVLGLTQVWYDTSTGKILEADIVLNDRSFQFTTNARDTSGYGSGTGGYAAGRGNVFIENVLTHELGHALGLSHSGGLQSTMLFMESPEQAHLGCDETVGIRAVYPTLKGTARGEISGTIVGQNGSPVFGAHVLAISRRRGTVLATALTDRAGNYRIGALEPGDYYLLAEPFYAGAQTLPAYYSAIRSDVCQDGRSFGRTVLTEVDGFRLKTVAVQALQAVHAPTLQVRCNGQGGASISPISRTDFIGTAPAIFSGGETGGFGVVDRFSSSGPNFYRLDGLRGNLELHVLSYSLYSPQRPSIELLDSGGNPVSADIYHQVYEGDSGYVNFDSAIVANGLDLGTYYVKVTGSAVDSNYYPAGPVSIDSVPFLMITGSVNEQGVPLAEEIPANARCRMEENFGAYSSPSGNPPRGDVGGGVGFCGTVQDAAGKMPRVGGPRPPTGALIGWFLPFLAMGGVTGLLKRRQRRAGRPH